MNSKIAILGHEDQSAILAKKIAEMHIEADLISLSDMKKENSYLDIPYAMAPYLAMAQAMEPRPSKSSIRKGCSNGHTYQVFYNETDDGNKTTTWVCSKCGKPME